MCSAMPRRIADMGSTISPSWAAGAGAGEPGAGAGAAGARRGAERRRRGAAGACGRRRAAAPPGLDEGEDVLLRHAAAAAGARDLRDVDAVLGRDPRDDRRDEARAVRPGRCRRGLAPPPGPRLGRRRGRRLASAPRRGRALGGGRLRGGLGRLLGGSGRSLRRRAPEPPRPRARSPRASVPTSTVSPSWTRICCTTPEAGLGTSVSTLSVEISSSDSSASIGSPSAFSHFVIVPSETETPIWGITTSTCGSGGHQYAASSRSPATTSSTWGRKAFSSGGENGTGVSGAAIRLHGRVEVLERLLGDRRGDLGAEAAGVRVLVEDDHLRRLLDRLEHRLAVPRDDRAQVDDLRRDAVLLGDLVRRLVGRVDHRAPRDDGDVVALAVDARLPERDRVALVRHLALDPAVQVLVLEVEDRVRVLDRGRRSAPWRPRASPGRRPSGPGCARSSTPGSASGTGPPEKPPPDGQRTTIGTGVPAR